MSDSLQPQGLQHARLLCPPVHRSLLKFMFIELVMLSDHLILCHPLLLLPSVFTSSRVFSFASGGQSTGVSASTSVLTMNSQDLLKDGLVGSPCNPRDSQESSTPQFKSINSLSLSFLYGPTFISIHAYWKNCSFD